MPLISGTRLGPYEVESALGSGGMGEVYRGRDARLRRSVALKVLTGTVAHDPQFRERFDREARAISALNHPNICTLFDVGQHDGIEFLVMELINGDTLAARIARGPVPTAEVLSIATQIGSALDAAHRGGIVHRDLKPGNIMLARAGTGSAGSPQVKLLDFGLARPVSRTEGVETTQAALTVHGDLLGTLPYMAPEQLEGRQVDARTDIWAFGCVLYEMVSGRRAFTASSDARLISEILTTKWAIRNFLTRGRSRLLNSSLTACMTGGASVIPSSSGRLRAGRPPAAITRSFSSMPRKRDGRRLKNPDSQRNDEGCRRSPITDAEPPGRCSSPSN